MNFWFSGSLDGELRFMADAWVLGVSVICCLLTVILLLPKKKHKKLYVVPELICWTLAIAGLIFVLSDPVLNSQVEKQEQSKAVILIDRSLSMSIQISI